MAVIYSRATCDGSVLSPFRGVARSEPLGSKNLVTWPDYPPSRASVTVKFTNVRHRAVKMGPCKVMAAFCGRSVSPTVIGTQGADPDIRCRVIFARVGGMAGAIVTSPFDVVKTRLQSSLFRETHIAVNVVANGMNGGVLTMPQGRSGLLRHFVETTHIIRCVEWIGLAAQNIAPNNT